MKIFNELYKIWNSVKGGRPKTEDKPSDNACTREACALKESEMQIFI